MSEELNDWIYIYYIYYIKDNELYYDRTVARCGPKPQRATVVVENWKNAVMNHFIQSELYQKTQLITKEII